jgi:hypothetical protein
MYEMFIETFKKKWDRFEINLGQLTIRHYFSISSLFFNFFLL